MGVFLTRFKFWAKIVYFQLIFSFFWLKIANFAFNLAKV